MPLKFSMEKCLHIAEVSQEAEATDASGLPSETQPKFKCKFRMPPPPAKKTQRGFLRASDVVLAKRGVRKWSIKHAATRSAATWPDRIAKSAATQEKRVVPSVLKMLVGSRPADSMPQTSASSSSRVNAPSDPLKNEQVYITDLLAQISTRRWKLNGCVWVPPPNPFQKAHEINDARKRLGEQLLNADELLVLVRLPGLFVWAPEFAFPGLQIRCPSCDAVVSSSTWWQPKILHSLCGHNMYVCRRHTCTNCARTKGGRYKKFLGDSPGALKALPQHIASLWRLFDNGKTLCEMAVVDMIRSMSTRTSWSALSDSMQEMKANAWTKDVVLRYLNLCSDLKVVHAGPLSSSGLLQGPSRWLSECRTQSNLPLLQVAPTLVPTTPPQRLQLTDFQVRAVFSQGCLLETLRRESIRRGKYV